MHVGVARVVAAGGRRGQGVRAVGDDQHTDRIGRPVDLGAQLPAAGQRGVGVLVAAVDADLRAGLGPDLTAHPAGDQRAQRASRPATRPRLRRQPDPHVGAEAGEGARGVRGPGRGRARPAPTPIQRGGNKAAAASTAAVRSATSAAAAPASSGTSTGADGTIAMALNTPPN